MKRSGFIQRKTRIRSSGKPLPARNERQRSAKKKRQSKKSAAARQSEGYRLALIRADGQCEALLVDGIPNAYVFAYDPIEDWPKHAVRCEGCGPLEAHHRHYMRYGGAETSDDFAVLGDPHHNAVESQLRPQNRGR